MLLLTFPAPTCSSNSAWCIRRAGCSLAPQRIRPRPDTKLGLPCHSLGSRFEMEELLTVGGDCWRIRNQRVIWTGIVLSKQVRRESFWR